MSLSRDWGESTSGVQRLWERGATDRAPHFTPSSRLDVKFAYGFAAFSGRGSLTPFAMASLAHEDGRSYRLGGRLAVGQSVDVTLEAKRRERHTATPVHEIRARAIVRF